MVYWISTALVSAFLAASAASYVFSAATIEGVRALGFPDHFRIQLAVMKVLAAAVLIIPAAPSQLKDWACAGACFFLVTAIVAHEAHGDSRMLHVINLGAIALVLTSYATAPK